MTDVLEITLVVATYLVVALFGMRALARLGFVTSKGGANTATWAPLIAAVAINLVIAGLVVVEYLTFDGSAAGLRLGLDLTDIGLAALGSVILLAAAALFAWASGARRIAPTAGLPLAALLVLALAAAALMEEITFRAVLIGTLRHDGVWIAALVSALVFTLIHFPTNRVSVEATIGWALGGLAFGGAWIAGAPLVVLTTWHLAHNIGNVLWVQPAAQFGLVEKPDAPVAARLTRYAFDAALMVSIALIGYLPLVGHTMI